MERLQRHMAHAPHQLAPNDAGGLVAALEQVLQSGSAPGRPAILDELRLSGKMDAAVDKVP